MLVGANTPELKQVAAEIMAREINVVPTHDLQAILWVSPVNGMIEWVVGFNAFLGKTCQMHVVNLTGKTTPRKLIWAAFHYPFVTCGLEYVFGILNSNNERAVEYDKKLGFTEVNRFHGAHDDGGDIVLLQMKRDDCRWVKELKNAA